MKNTNLSTKLLMAAVVLTVLIYFGMNLAAYFSDPFSTTVAYEYTDRDAVTVSGYVIREEQAIEAAGEYIYFSRSEGERVSRGGSVALSYSDQETLDRANTVRALEEQLSQLLYARALADGVHSTVSLDKDVDDALAAFHIARASGALSAAGDAADAVRSAVLRHSYAYTGTDELDRAIARLSSEISALSDGLSASTTAVRAPKSGLFSSLADGYESVLTMDAIKTMTPEDYRSIAPAEVRGVGKMVYGSKWYFATLMQAADAKDLSKGDRVILRFQTGLDRELTMTVDRVSEEDGGQKLVILSSDKDLSLTTLLRRQNAQIIFKSYTGIRVPRSAVRIVWETETDENGDPILTADGSEKKRQIFGVYCMWGNTAKFKKVEILWQEDEYMLVRSLQAGDVSRRLRPGDEVITAAADLYDGKVIE